MKVAAFFLSLFAPGSGQLLLGHRRRAIVWLAVAVLVYPVFAALLPGLARAGFVLIGALLLGGASLVRLLCAIEAVRLERLEARPGSLVVAGWFVGALALMVGASVGTRVWLLEAYKVPAASMMPTLLVGDHMFVDKKAKALRRGHLLVFRYPENRAQDFVKRVIAVGGDRLEMRAGHPWINGWEVPHCDAGPVTFDLGEGSGPKHGEVFVEYLGDVAYLTIVEPEDHPNEGPWEVPSDGAMVLGDNRDNSHDSRRWFGGAGGSVHPDDVRGEPVVIWLSARDTGVDFSRVDKPLSEPFLPHGMQSVQAGFERCMKSRPPTSQCNPPPI